jgi:hypothetical protein
MCQRTYSIPTNRGLIEVTKGTFLTYNKRKHQQVSHTHNIAPAKIKAKRKSQLSRRTRLDLLRRG